METGKRRKPNFLNTYQLEPTDGKPKLSKIKELMLSVVSGTYAKFALIVEENSSIFSSLFMIT